MSGPRRWSAQQLTQLAAGVLVVLTLLGAASCLMVGRQLKLVTRELRAEQRLLAVEQTLGGELSQLEAAAAKLRDKTGALEPTVAPEQFVPTLITQLSELATRHGLRLVGTAPAADEVAARLARPNEPVPSQRQRLTASFAGGYPQLLELVNGLQQAPKALSLTALRIRSDGTAGAGTIVADLDLVADPTPGILRPEDVPPPRLGWNLLNGVTGETYPQPSLAGADEPTRTASPDEALPDGPGLVAPPPPEQPWNVPDRTPAAQSPSVAERPADDAQPGRRNAAPEAAEGRAAAGAAPAGQGEGRRAPRPGGGSTPADNREGAAGSGAGGRTGSGGAGGQARQNGGAGGAGGQSGQRPGGSAGSQGGFGGRQGGPGGPGGNQGRPGGQGRQRPSWLTPEMEERLRNMSPEERREFFQRMRQQQGQGGGPGAGGGGENGAGRRGGNGEGGQGGGEMNGSAADQGLVF